MKRIYLPLTGVLALAAVTLSLLVGRYPLSPGELVEIVLGRCADAMKRNVFWNIRLPRTAWVCLSGAALSLSGWVMQSIFQNPLVAPDVLGVSGGCSVGAIVGILLGLPAALTQGCSLLCGLATVLLVMALTRAVGRRQNSSLLLAGIVISALANSVIMLLKYTADPNHELAAIEYWLMGSFHAAQWPAVGPACLPVLLCLTLSLTLAAPIRLMMLGDEEARALGVPTGFVKAVALMAATGLTAGVVSVSGSVSWLGLIVPHLCRLMIGERPSTPWAALFTGAALLTLADVAARTLTAGEIPISILTSFMGAVFLAILLVCGRLKGRAAWTD